MADYSRRSDDGVKAHAATGGDAPASTEKANTLVVTHEHLMVSVDPWKCGCRHLMKVALEEVHKHHRTILEHPGPDGQLMRRVIKEYGYSCTPYYVDPETGERIKVTAPDGTVFE